MYDELIKALRFCAMTDLSKEEYPCDPCKYEPPEKYHIRNEICYLGCSQQMMLHAADAIEELSKRPEIPTTGIGDLSDGYHTFNGLYYQRMVLFAVIVRTYKEKSWKSWKHEDGEPCFGGKWFIVGIDTPQGSYTYHYEDKYWNWFECKELPKAKHWDGHTEEDVTRLLSLPTPLIKLPPHGDLIGREWLIDIALHLMNTAKNDDIADGVKWLWQYIIEAPTIIESEEEK